MNQASATLGTRERVVTQPPPPMPVAATDDRQAHSCQACGNRSPQGVPASEENQAEHASRQQTNHCPMPLHEVHRLDDLFENDRHEKGNHWSVVWSDLMMTMFILFVVLYCYQIAHQKFLGGNDVSSSASSSSGAGDIEPVTGGDLASADDRGAGNDQQMSILYNVSRDAIDSFDLHDIANINLAPDKTVRIVLTGDLLFDVGKAAIKENAKASLQKIARVLELNPYMINVVGHTDNLPMHSDRYPTNWELSSLRATAVARHLIEERGLPGHRFCVIAHSYFRPVKPNDTINNRASNRRVEIIITRNLPTADASMNVGTVALQ